MNVTGIISERVRFPRPLQVLLLAALFTAAWQPMYAAPKDADAFEPLGFPGDDVVVTDDVPAAGHRPANARTAGRPGSADSAAAPLVLQVQFLATTNLSEAKDVKQRAETALKDSVRLEFETPYYKLQTGNFTEYDEAEALAVRLRAMWYESAWVVRVKKSSAHTSPVE